MRGSIAIEGHLLRNSLLLDRLLKKPLCRSHIALFTEQKVYGLSHFIDATIEVSPLPADLDVGLIDSPRRPDRLSVPVPVLLKLRDIALHPPHNGGVRHLNAPLRHHFPQVSIA